MIPIPKEVKKIKILIKCLSVILFLNLLFEKQLIQIYLTEMIFAKSKLFNNPALNLIKKHLFKSFLCFINIEYSGQRHFTFYSIII